MDCFYGPREEVVFSGKLRPVDVAGLDHLSIQSVISIGLFSDAPLSSVFKLNVSYLDFTEF